MQRLVSLASFAACCYAAGTVYGENSLKVKKDSKDLVKGTISGGWDLLKNGSKYDMLVTLNQVIDFTDTEKFSNGDEWSMFTCYDVSEFWGKDHCWQVLAKRVSNKWEYTSTMYYDDDLEKFDNDEKDEAPKADSSDRVWSAKWVNGKASVVKANSDFKTYDQLITESSGNKITAKVQFMVREKKLYDEFLDGHFLIAQSVLWVADSDSKLDDDEYDWLDFNFPSSTEDKLVGSSSSQYNLVSGSTPDMSIFCSATNNGSNECNGSICSNNSECQSKICSNKICTKNPSSKSSKLPYGSLCSTNSDCQSSNCGYLSQQVTPVTVTNADGTTTTTTPTPSAPLAGESKTCLESKPLTDAEAAAAVLIIIILLVVCCCCGIGCGVYCCVAGVACFAKSASSRPTANPVATQVVIVKSGNDSDRSHKSDKSNKSKKSSD